MAMKTINGIVVTEDRFAFDGCHKTYLIGTDAEAEDARGSDYEIHAIDELPRIWATTCPLRFVQRWRDFATIIDQFENARFDGWDIDDELAEELRELEDEDIIARPDEEA
jgi:hypothetical protein